MVGGPGSILLGVVLVSRSAPMTRGLPKPSVLVAATFIVIYFLYFTAGSLRAEFTYDDLMNCYRGWFRSLPALVADNVFFFRYSPTYRPFGALVYKVFFHLAGFDLYPLRVLLLVTLACNVFLVHKLCSALTGSVELGLFAALSFAYHMKFWPLYYATGTLYDIFCFTFFLSALLFYIHVRRHRRSLSGSSLFVFAGLYVLALNSKESAVVFPAALLLYELLWHGPVPTRQALVPWMTRRIAGVWITAAITAAYLTGRVFSPELGISSTGGYKVVISVREYLSKAGFYLGELFYAPDWFNPLRTAMLLLTLLLVGVFCRSRSFLFGALFFVLGILPLAFIPERPLSAVYLPLAGLAICAAVLLGFAVSALRRLSQREVWRTVVFLLIFLAAGASLARVHPPAEHIYLALDAEYRRISETREQLKLLYPEMPSDSRVLILETPFPQYSPGYQTLFLVRLVYRDESLVVEELAKFRENRQTPTPADYDFIVTYKNGQLVDMDPNTLASDLGSF